MRAILLVAAAALWAGQAGAATIDGIGITATNPGPTFESIQIVEDGYVYTTSAAYPSGAITLHDDYGTLGTEITRVDGGLFTPVSMLFQSWALSYRAALTPRPADDEDVEAWAKTISIFGLINIYGYDEEGNEVREIIPANNALGTFTFGPAFKNLVSLYIELGTGGYHYYEGDYPTTPGEVWCFEYCGQISVYSLTINEPSPVPLPATAPMLVAGAVGLGFLRRRR